jgi:hypothetical protein
MWSDTILDEMERTVVRLFVQQGRTAEDAAHIASHRRTEMVNSCPEVAITGYESLVDGMKNTPKIVMFSPQPCEHLRKSS